MMAYSPEQWERAKALFESGQFSLSEISEQIGISKSKISEKSKKEQWERGRNADYIEARKLVAKKQGTEKGTVIRTLDKVADDQIRREGIIFDNSEKIAAKIGKLADAVDSASDIKLLAEANDRVAVTMRVAERFAPKQDINLTNAQQNNNPPSITLIRES